MAILGVFHMIIYFILAKVIETHWKYNHVYFKTFSDIWHQQRSLIKYTDIESIKTINFKYLMQDNIYK